MHRNRRILGYLLILILSLQFAACSKKATPRPNQINDFDSATYTSLMDAKAALDSAKEQYNKGTLPQTFTTKQVINIAGGSYNLATNSYKTWRDINLGVTTGDANAAKAKLQEDMQNLSQSIAQVIALSKGAK